jgi:hypothetical protein
MITTPQEFLDETSAMLKEATTDVSNTRLRYFYRAARKVLSMAKFASTRKPFTLALTAGVQEYDLSLLISDFNPLWGIYEVYVNSEKIDPVDYPTRSQFSSSTRYYYKEDDKTLGFTKIIAGTETIIVYYYPRLVKPTAADTVLNISFPEDMLTSICLYMKHLVHEGKRQRYDSRNALLDFKEEMDTLRPQNASNKARGMPKIVPNIMTTSRFRRRYP